MNFTFRKLRTVGTVFLTLTVVGLALGQEQSDLTKTMGITQNLGQEIPKDAKFIDETGHERTLGSLLKGRPLMIVPLSLTCKAGCKILLDGLQKTLYRADHRNDRKVIKTDTPNKLKVGQAFDIVLLSLDPRETPQDAAETKNNFEKKVGYNAEPVTVLTGKLDQIQRVTDAIGFKYFLDMKEDIIRNATGSVLLTPDGRISSYTIGNDFPTIIIERSLETATKGETGPKADDTQKFGCIQLGKTVIAKRGRIELIYTLAGLLTLGVVATWIGLMLRQERQERQYKSSDLGGQSRGA